MTNTNTHVLYLSASLKATDSTQTEMRRDKVNITQHLGKNAYSVRSYDIYVVS